MLAVLVVKDTGTNPARTFHGRHARLAAHAMVRRYTRRGIECRLGDWQPEPWFLSPTIMRCYHPTRSRDKQEYPDHEATLTEIAKMLDREYPKEPRHTEEQVSAILRVAMNKLRRRGRRLRQFLDQKGKEISPCSI